MKYFIKLLRVPELTPHGKGFSLCISISICLNTTSSLHMLSAFREEDDDEYCFVSRGQGLGASVDCQVFNCLSRRSLREGCSIVLIVRWFGSLFSLIDDSDFVLSLLFINFQS